MAEPNRTLPPLSPKDIERFWSKVDRNGPDECWPWQAATFDKHGTRRDNYGAFKCRRLNLRANRVAYFIATGDDPGPFKVCHACDNPPCCNPAHLFKGTTADNAQDCRQKGRLNTPAGDRHRSRTRPDSLHRGDEHWSRRLNERCARGERNGTAKLNPDLVRAIRFEYANKVAGCVALSRKYGVCSQTITNIVRRKVWKHVA